jgi:hypothetical protein
VWCFLLVSFRINPPRVTESKRSLRALKSQLLKNGTD